MSDKQLALLINHDKRLSFVQGEDRELSLQVYDTRNQTALGLSGYELIFAMPMSGGGSIKARTAPLVASFSTATVLNGDTVFAVEQHGLVPNQAVTMQALLGDAILPDPFVADAPLQVVVTSQDTFALRTSLGGKLALTAPSAITASLNTSTFTVSDAVLGIATYQLNSTASQVAALGQGQSYQLTLIDPLGGRRILIGDAQLDVAAQPCP